MVESARHVWSRWIQTVGLAILGMLVVGGGPRPIYATIKYGAVQISGNLESQNLVRDPEVDKFQFIQNRNTFRLRFDWDWLQNGKLIDKYDIPFIERSKLFLLYRGVYDGFYEIQPTDLQRGQTR
ncbi:MAG TPA: hypothetical protein VL403_04935, partial [Candidatus Kryptonia bacterium]|nr:hypothetical protein [Candidatus Kryptonia bacterium]